MGELAEFFEFDRVGVFRYSDEESCGSFGLADKVPARIAERRHRKLMTLQRGISQAKNARLVGRELEVLVQGPSDEHEYVTMARHAGQVAFPGGRMDPGDVSAEAAALREAHEEVGLDPAIPELAGRLPEHLTGTGFRITPILAFLPPGLELVPQEDEVASIFILPLSTLLDPAAPQRQRREFRGRQREFWVWPHPEHYIWGATASILVSLAGRLQHAAAA